MTTTRAKFRCNSVQINSYGPRQYEFTAVMDNDTPENQRFAKSTPSGVLKMAVDNPDVDLLVGQAYYLDLTLAE